MHAVALFGFGRSSEFFTSSNFTGWHLILWSVVSLAEKTSSYSVSSSSCIALHSSSIFVLIFSNCLARKWYSFCAFLLSSVATLLLAFANILSSDICLYFGWVVCFFFIFPVSEFSRFCISLLLSFELFVVSSDSVTLVFGIVSGLVVSGASVLIELFIIPSCFEAIPLSSV